MGQHPPLRFASVGMTEVFVRAVGYPTLANGGPEWGTHI